MRDKNVTNIGKEDRTFIKAVVELPEEKKILLRGILIGMELRDTKVST